MDHAQRVQQELVAAGVSPYGLRKSVSRYVAKVLHNDEHIGGVVYGRYENGSGKLVATDKRVLFLDKKQFFTADEEVSYAVVSGIKISRSGIITSLTLHTRVKDFSLRYVNQACALGFKKYVESRSLEGDDESRKTPGHDKSAHLSANATAFLQSNDVAVLSTLSKKNRVSGAVVYYVVDDSQRIHLLTKADTSKVQNIIAHKAVALTVFDQNTAQTLQIEGVAKVEADEQTKRDVFTSIMKPHKYTKGYALPPVAWIEAGMFVIITITITSAKYSDFSKKKG